MPGHGPLETAKMFFVGEAPGPDEVDRGRPLVGGSGRIFTKQCNLTGINRELSYLTNVVKCRPVNSKGENRPPTDTEIAHCSQYLIPELRASKANVIVALGRTALNALTSKQSLEKYRGVPIEVGGRKVVATFNPAALMQQQDMWPVALFDLKRAKQESFFPEVQIAPVSYNTNASAAVDGARVLEAARRTGYVVFDIETAGFNPRAPNQGALDPSRSQVLCIGFGTETHRADCFRWTPETNALTREIAGDSEITKVGQNSENFDIPYLEGKDISFRGPSFDTMQAFHLTNSSLPKDLAFISTFYADFPNWKEKRGTDLFTYNCKDVDATARAYTALKQELPRMGLDTLFYSTICPIQPKLRAMSRSGIKKNTAKAELWSMKIRLMADKEEQVLRDATGIPWLNVQSPKQLAELFYDKMGLPVQYTKDQKSKEMRPTCDKKALERLAELTDNPIFHKVVDIRQARQVCSTFIDVAHDENSFVHPHFHTNKASTGRVASEDPNGQNIPIQIREIYEPDSPDHIFIEFDWSQIEWRLQVVLSGDRRGLELLNSGLDNHTAVAAEILGKPYADITPVERFNAKFVVHGLGYGRGAESIARQYRIPTATVKDFVSRFSRRFSDFWSWRDLLLDRVGRQAYLANPFGRRRWWFSRVVTEIYNFSAQSTAADMMLATLNGMFGEAVPGWSLRLTVHDSLLACGPKDNVREAWAWMQTWMLHKWPGITEASARPELVEQYYPGGWFCKADGTVGENWKECKPNSKEEKVAAAARLKYYGLEEAA